MLFQINDTYFTNFGNNLNFSKTNKYHWIGNRNCKEIEINFQIFDLIKYLVTLIIYFKNH